MRKQIYMRTAAPAIACIVAFLAVCANRAYGYNRMGLDRILLMNDDTKTFRAVTGQAYTNTTLATGQDGAFWEHSGNFSFGSTAAALALFQGTNHVYRSVSSGVTNILWTVENAAAGSMARTDAGWNFIPVSQTALPSLYEWDTCTTNARTGKITYTHHAITNANSEIVFLNVQGAAVTSPFYAEGIGTIYFDAVNASPSVTTQSLQLQIATNSIGEVDFNGDTPLSECDWKPVPVDVFAVENKSTVSRVESDDDTLILLNSEIDSGNLFFRVRKRLQYFGPIRFRIVRATVNAQHSVGTMADFIDIDNIIASYPVKTVALHECGAYDETLEGVAVRGWSPAFTTAFPAVGEAGVKGRVSLEYFGDFTIPEAYGVTKDLEIKKVKMNYRWRYLDQITNAWTTVEMRSTDDEGVNWETVEDLDLGDGVGDVEYNFSAELTSPYYLFGDYTGCDLVGYPEDWLERITAVGHSAKPEEDFANDHNNLSPALGKDFFIRLREGVSQYERVQLLHTAVELADADAVVDDDSEEPAAAALSPIDLELVSDHLWRGYLKIPTNHVDSVDFHFLGLNFTENGATELAENSSSWKPVDGNVSDLPYSGLVELTDGPQTGTIKIDAAQGYLMFEFNEQFGTFTVTHADYQNFNLWTDVAKGSSFVGDVNEVTGVPREKQDYPEFFTNLTIETSASLNTNEYSVESFYGGNEANIQYAWTRNIPFVSKLSPNGWTCDYGEWASEKFITNNLAFRMAGCGYGAISLQNRAARMNGVESFEFNARVSQYLGFESFSYNETKTTDKNYGISAGVAMSTSNGGDMSPETPSISLVAYYRPNEGCYEFRATRYDKAVVRLELYKWAKSGYEIKSTQLVKKDVTAADFISAADTKGNAVTNWLQNGEFSATMKLYGMYMWVTNETSTGRAVIGAGIAREKKSVPNVRQDHPEDVKFFDYSKGETDMDSADNSFFRITWVDGSNPLKRGAYGVGANDCRARFNLIGRHGMASGFSPTIIDSELPEFSDGNWTPAIGRSELYTLSPHNFGITNIVSPQAMNILFAYADDDSLKWTDDIGYTVKVVGKNNAETLSDGTVTDFQNTKFKVEVNSTSNYFPRLQHGASAFSPRTDIVVDDLQLKGYRGIPATKWTAADRNKWVWTETWIDKVSNTEGFKCTFDPKRVNPTYPLSLRSPKLDGISMLTFRYYDAKPGVKLFVQIWTNNMENVSSEVVRMTQSPNDPDWKTVDTIEFSGNPSSGTHTTYISLRSPVTGFVRIIMDPKIVAAAVNGDATAQAKTISIYAPKTTTKPAAITAWNEPALDEYSWTGWNMLVTDNGDKAYLPDPAMKDPPGLSGALNNSVSANIKPGTLPEWYGYHNPYVQSPVANVESGIGLVSFKARKYAANQDPATVTLLGASNPSAPDTEWKTLTNIVVDTASYKTYEWTAPGDKTEYKSIRFSVDGVAANYSVPTYRLNPQRVLLEEIVVSEPVAPQMKFASVMPFRSGLFDKGVIENLLAPEQQPLVGENFGFQAELKLNQLADELDADSVVVHVKYYHGASPWGYENWKDLPGAVEITLPAVEGTNLIFRSTYDEATSVVMPFDQTSPGTLNVVQYHAWATYRKKGDSLSSEVELRHDLSEGEWTHGASAEGTYSYPSWYWPLNLNEKYGGGSSENFSAYMLLDTVSPYRAWINEFNIYDGEPDEVPTNQFVEVAVPIGADLTGWCVRASDMHEDEQVLFEFGSDVPATKYENATNHFAFISVGSPETVDKYRATQCDGKWSTSFPMLSGADGRLNYFEPYSLELVRPTGVIEQQIVVAGTNMYLDTGLEYWYAGTNRVAKMKKASRKGSSWTYNGADMTRGTLGAMANYGQGGLASDGGTWEEDLKPTAGKVNMRWDGTLEDIDEDWFLEANGTNVWVFASVISDHIAQKSGLYTGKAFRIVLPHGITTNICYETEDWWRIAYITMNGEEVPAAKGKKNFELVLENLTTNVDVIAAASPAGSLTNGTGFAIDETNIYTTAVLDWLGDYPEINEDGTTNEIKMAWFYNPYGTVRHRQLTLTEMYWLGITPIQQCQLWAGMKDNVWGRCPEQVVYYDRDGATIRPVTNIRVTVFMMVTNLEENTAWSPFRLQTVDRIQSDDFVNETSWPGVTFKIEAQLPNVAPNNWVPLRYFVFQDGSFKDAPGEPDDHCARIEVWDPFDNGSAAYEAGWSRYRFVDTPLLRWNLDSSRVPMEVEVLKPDSTYKNE